MLRFCQKLDLAKERGVKELTFSKNKNLDLRSLTSPNKIDRFLKFFRAGIEAAISLCKRIFGLSRIIDKTKTTFKAVAQAAAVSCNLMLLARLEIHSKAAQT